MTTYYDALNDFYKLNEQEPLAPSAQLLYLHLLHRNNRLGNRGHVQVSDRMLELTTRISKQSITDAKRNLKSHGLIDFKTEKSNPRAGTHYTLKCFTAGQNPGQNPGQSLSINPKVTLHEDLKTKDLKTKELTLSDKRACANSKEFEDLLEYWDEKLRGGRLSFEHQSEILIFVERYGFEWVKAAMTEAADTNGSHYGVNMKLLRAVVERKANPKPKKSKGRENVGTREYAKPPEYDFIDEWEREQNDAHARE